jgi:hypothetical protein
MATLTILLSSLKPVRDRKKHSEKIHEMCLQVLIPNAVVF